MKNQVHFSDTQIAFQHLSDGDLRQAKLLFGLINNNFLVQIGKPILQFALKLGLPVKGLIKATVFKQFCGGESIQECEKTIAVLAKFNLQTILDYSGEGKESEEDFKKALEYILSTVEKARTDKRIAFCVFKVTGLSRQELLTKISSGKELSPSEKLEFDLLKSRVEEICARCVASNVSLFIDAEETWFQKVIDEMVDAMMEKYNREKAIIFNTLQLYRTDRIEFLKASHQRSLERGYFLGMKLVRGAYLEKERQRAIELKYNSPLHKTKSETDKDFDIALRYCVSNYKNIAVCAGTHNEQSTRLLIDLLDENKIPVNHPHFYFSQLLGMSDHLSFNLAKTGYNVAKYVPFGPVETVMPYLFRRAEENTAIAGQMSREFALIQKEIKRRADSKK